ncbi:MAG: hypothetical protein NTW04_02470 [Elusimicrobia bacterium]|nr:hypothetical protein [Elusimicrobiota bacterium]
MKFTLNKTDKTAQRGRRGVAVWALAGALLAVVPAVFFWYFSAKPNDKLTDKSLAANPAEKHSAEKKSPSAIDSKSGLELIVADKNTAYAIKDVAYGKPANSCGGVLTCGNSSTDKKDKPISLENSRLSAMVFSKALYDVPESENLADLGKAYGSGKERGKPGVGKVSDVLAALSQTFAASHTGNFSGRGENKSRLYGAAYDGGYASGDISRQGFMGGAASHYISGEVGPATAENPALATCAGARSALTAELNLRAGQMGAFSQKYSTMPSHCADVAELKEWNNALSSAFDSCSKYNTASAELAKSCGSATGQMDCGLYSSMKAGQDYKRGAAGCFLNSIFKRKGESVSAVLAGIDKDNFSGFKPDNGTFLQKITGKLFYYLSALIFAVIFFMLGARAKFLLPAGDSSERRNVEQIL